MSSVEPQEDQRSQHASSPIKEPTPVAPAAPNPDMNENGKPPQLPKVKSFGMDDEEDNESFPQDLVSETGQFTGRSPDKKRQRRGSTKSDPIQISDGTHQDEIENSTPESSQPHDHASQRPTPPPSMQAPVDTQQRLFSSDTSSQAASSAAQREFSSAIPNATTSSLNFDPILIIQGQSGLGKTSCANALFNTESWDTFEKVGNDMFKAKMRSEYGHGDNFRYIVGLQIHDTEHVPLLLRDRGGFMRVACLQYNEAMDEDHFFDFVNHVRNMLDCVDLLPDLEVATIQFELFTEMQPKNIYPHRVVADSDTNRSVILITNCDMVIACIDKAAPENDIPVDQRNQSRQSRSHDNRSRQRSRSRGQKRSFSAVRAKSKVKAVSVRYNMARGDALVFPAATVKDVRLGYASFPHPATMNAPPMVAKIYCRAPQRRGRSTRG